MSVKKNALANYIGQGYTILIGIVVTPLYLKYLGAEAFGLVGFFALMQAWMLVVDLGMTPTLSRQIAYARGQENGFNFFGGLFKSFETIFLGLSIVIAICIFFSSNWIAQNWVKAEALEVEIIAYCISFMGVIIGLRWIAGLYRSGINGLEDQVWLNVANSILISLKFIGALILLAFVTQDIRHFFEYQLVISLIELFILAQHFYRKIPAAVNSLGLFYFNWSSVKYVVPYTSSVAYIAVIWALITQTDKLILSGVLSLTEFGYLSLVAIVSGGITMLSGPISEAIMPRMTVLLAQGKKEEMLRTYSKGGQVVTFITFAVALIVGLYAEQLLYAWTGNHELSMWGTEILFWFSLGNGVLAIGAFQYYLQIAFGQLRLHVIGSTISALIQVPIIYFAAINYGALGAGISWFCFRVFWFILWTPIVHRKFVPGLHLSWLCRDILPIVGTLSLVALVLFNLFDISLDQNRLLIFSKLAVLGVGLLTFSALSSSFVRFNFTQFIRLKF